MREEDEDLYHLPTWTHWLVGATIFFVGLLLGLYLGMSLR